MVTLFLVLGSHWYCSRAAYAESCYTALSRYFQWLPKFGADSATCRITGSLLFRQAPVLLFFCDPKLLKRGTYPYHDILEYEWPLYLLIWAAKMETLVGTLLSSSIELNASLYLESQC
jgi:hypothetical protein